jgi:predicted branched-subunit amino acid permease
VTRGAQLFSAREFRSGAITMLPIAVALAPFGLVCGVAAANAGTSPLAALGLSAIVFSGAAQIVITDLYASGAPAAVIVMTCFVVSLRLALYSAAVAPHVQSLPARWRNALAYVVTDQVFAGSIRRLHDSADKGAAASHFVGGGAMLWLGWQITDTVGYFAGNAIPSAWSLDFAVPLCFIALLAPLLRERPMIVAALVAAIAVVALDALPMRLNIISAGLAGIAAGTVIELALEHKKRR